MGFDRKTLYMMLGGVLALALVFGAVVAFAQTNGDDDGTDAVPLETEEGSSGEAPVAPGWGWHGFRGSNRPPASNMTSDHERLAEALGISVEELQAAYEEARSAIIEQALAAGLITQDQADRLLSDDAGFRGRLGHGFMGLVNHDEFLAEALGISVEELQEARAAAQAAKLQEMMEAGILTQEQVDLMTAQQSVQAYMDREALSEALSEMIQNAYEAAVEQALADGAISQEQADLLLENTPRFAPFGGRGFPGTGGFRGGRGFHGGPAPFFRGQPPASSEPTVDPTANV